MRLSGGVVFVPITELLRILFEKTISAAKRKCGLAPPLRRRVVGTVLRVRSPGGLAPAAKPPRPGFARKCGVRPSGGQQVPHLGFLLSGW